jgi:hypothetical protein
MPNQTFQFPTDFATITGKAPDLVGDPSMFPAVMMLIGLGCFVICGIIFLIKWIKWRKAK